MKADGKSEKKRRDFIMRSETIISYWSAKNFDDRLNYALETFRNNGYEIVEIQFKHNWCFYCASILYK